MAKFNQGLIEMDNIDQATELISYSHKNDVIIKGKKAEFSYSKSQSINQDVIKRNQKQQQQQNYSHPIKHTLRIF